jgi:hypothetical protein
MNILHDKWPRCRRAAEKGDELAPPHSRTSLARATNTSDKEMPSDAAVEGARKKS